MIQILFLLMIRLSIFEFLLQPFFQVSHEGQQ